MKLTHHVILGALVAPCFIAATTLAAADAPTADTIGEAFAKGKVSVNVRGRYEGASQTALKDSDAYTVRTRLGFSTAPINGFKASVEFEDIASPNPDHYNQAGINPGGAGRAVVADPVGSELNQAWVAYTSGKTTATLGRQRLVLDNARFVGDVGWRQNQQTFDAFTLVDKSVDKLTLTYSYLDRINRVFGDRSTQGAWDSNSHLVNASYTGLPAGTLTGYAYLIDITSAGFTANSCATYGASFAGAQPLSKELKLAYRAEYATQSDYGSSTLNYSTDYYLGELAAVTKPVTIGAGYEVLGTDHNVGFKTPLATLHAFDGWADLFLATPAGGLHDTYGKVATTLPGKIGLLAFYHSFETDTGVDLGKEWDVQLTHAFNKYFTGLVKYAKFDRDSTTVANVKKLWVQLEFAY